MSRFTPLVDGHRKEIQDFFDIVDKQLVKQFEKITDRGAAAVNGVIKNQSETVMKLAATAMTSVSNSAKDSFTFNKNGNDKEENKEDDTIIKEDDDANNIKDTKKDK